MRKILNIAILFSLSCLSYSFITKDERKLVKKLKSMTIGSLNTHDIAKLELNGYIENYVNKTSDLMFLNFVKHSDKELKKATQMLLTNLEWRKLNDIDNVEEWDPPEGMIQDFPYQITGYTRKENPVLYIAGGRWDFQKWVSMGHGNDVIKYFIQMIERAQMATKGKFDPDTGDEPSQYITIVNMEGFSIRQVTSIRVLRMLGSFFGIYDANYPLATEDLVILKAPQIFAVFFDFVKNFLKISGQERYIGFVRLIGNDENIWKPILFNAIPTEAIPKALGGKFDIPY